MSRDEILRILEMNIDNEVWVTFQEEKPQLLRIVNVDSEGFVNQTGDELFWSTFEDVIEVQTPGTDDLPAVSSQSER